MRSLTFNAFNVNPIKQANEIGNNEIGNNDNIDIRGFTTWKKSSDKMLPQWD